MFVQVAKMKAPAPMTGGMSWPPVLAAASTAPAKRGRNPALRMMGIVKEPVVTTLATALPERDPMKAEATAAVLAGPPRVLPARRFARPMRSPPPPEHGAEEDEEEDEVGAHPQRDPPDPLRGEEEVFDQSLRSVPPVGQ